MGRPTVAGGHPVDLADVVVGGVLADGLELRAEPQPGPGCGPPRPSAPSAAPTPCGACRGRSGNTVTAMSWPTSRSCWTRPSGPEARTTAGGRTWVPRWRAVSVACSSGPAASRGSTPSSGGTGWRIRTVRLAEGTVTSTSNATRAPRASTGGVGRVATGVWRRTTRASAAASPTTTHAARTATAGAIGTSAATTATSATRAPHRNASGSTRRRGQHGVGVNTASGSTRRRVTRPRRRAVAPPQRGIGTLDRTVRSASSGRKRSSSASGVSTSRWRNTGPATLTTSSGTT